MKCYACPRPATTYIRVGDTKYPVCEWCKREHEVNNRRAVEWAKAWKEKCR